MSNLTSHAKKELKRAGLFMKDSDYGGMIGKAVMDLIKVFSKQGHSGFSATIVLNIFRKVANFKPLTKITSDPSEWDDISETSGKPMWQSNRNTSLFSENCGKTWYDIEEK